MADKFTNVNERTASGELMGNEGVTKVVNLNIFNTSHFKVAIKTRTNVADKEWITSFGNKNFFGFTLGAVLKVCLNSFFNRLAKRNVSLGV